MKIHEYSPGRDQCVLGPLLHKWSTECPDKTFLTFEDDTSWTFAETLQFTREAAAIPVPSELGEDEVMLVVSETPEKEVLPEELLNFMVPRMAHFMLPRYIRVMPELPKTPTQKIQKNLLREQGITADTWDREEHGFRIRNNPL